MVGYFPHHTNNTIKQIEAAISQLCCLIGVMSQEDWNNKGKSIRLGRVNPRPVLHMWVALETRLA